MEIMMAGRFARMILDGHKTQTRRVGARWGTVKVGDVLHVREAFCANYASPSPDMPLGCAYRADYDRARLHGLVPEPRWTPAVHMPLNLCRCKIRVTAVRNERIKAISEDDASAEGVGQMGVSDLLQMASSRRIKAAIGVHSWESVLTWWDAVSACDRYMVLIRLLGADIESECTVIEFEVVQ